MEIPNRSGQTYSLAERSALANGDLVTLLDTESGRNVGGNVLVALLVTRVLRDEVEVLAADDSLWSRSQPSDVITAN